MRIISIQIYRRVQRTREVGGTGEKAKLLLCGQIGVEKKFEILCTHYAALSRVPQDG